MGVRDLAPAAEPLLRGPSVRERVRWSDVDMMGIVFFGNYLRFMQAAESELFRALGFPYGALAELHGVWLARAHVDLDFRTPARLDDEVDCSAHVMRVGGASFDIAFPMTRADDGTRLADGRLVLASVDTVTLKSVRLPAALRTAFGVAS
jgi:YbgC/YbaW family acyl-CoA thioester hydrolase